MTSRPHGPLALVLAASLALAASAPAGAATNVTVYSRDLGFVREDVTLAARDTVRIEVPERIDFSSVRLVPARGDVRRLSYRYDLATGDRALERAIGTKIRATLRSDRVVEGTLLAADHTWITVREADGSYHTVARGALDDVRLAPPREPVIARPTLEAVLAGPAGGAAELSYLTGGLSWSAEHVVVRRGETRASWTTRAIVENTTGREFASARLKLIAGELGRVSPPPMPVMRQMEMTAVGNAAGKGADMSEQSFADYHLYTIAEPATLRNGESQSLTMLPRRDVTVTPRYVFRGDRVWSQLKVENAKADGLGEPLPGGRVRFYDVDADGAVQFTGEARMNHTPVDEEFTLDVGAAFDLVGERKEVSSRRISDREREYTVAIELRNRKKTNVTIEVEEYLAGDGEVTQSTHKYERKESNQITFTVPVAAGQEVVLRYTARVRW